MNDIRDTLWRVMTLSALGNDLPLLSYSKRPKSGNDNFVEEQARPTGESH
jgi:hypothetical protein